MVEFLNTLMADTQRRATVMRWLFLLEVLAAILTALGEAAKVIYPGLDVTSAHLYFLFHAVEAVILVCMAVRTLMTWSQREASSFRALSAAATIAVLFVSVASLRLASMLALIHDGLLAMRARDLRAEDLRFYQRLSRKPAMTLVVTFALVSFVGTVLLALPSSHYQTADVGIFDAFFTAVSATCVTGLATVDTATAWTPFGLTVLLLLIQIGGLGIMVFGSALSLSMGQKLRVFERDLVEDVFDPGDTSELRALLKGVLLFTFLIEAVGAACLYPVFSLELSWDKALFYAVFHSVSAFCNAGFALFSDSLIGFQSDAWVNGVILTLFSLGGLGFGVLVGLWRLLRHRRQYRLSIHARGVLVVSAVLLFGGAVLWYAFESYGLLHDKSVSDGLLVSLFQSASTRTAGFNTIPLESLQSTTVILMSTLMLIGASPGSTGGGIKTTTILVVALAIRSFIRGKREVVFYFRTIEFAIVLKALAILGAVLAAFFVGVLALLYTDPTVAPLKIIFEAASALGTTGLSMGVTGELSTSGQLVLCILMFFGRLGPLTIATAALSDGPKWTGVKYPTGRINVG